MVDRVIRVRIRMLMLEGIRELEDEGMLGMMIRMVVDSSSSSKEVILSTRAVVGTTINSTSSPIINNNRIKVTLPLTTNNNNNNSLNINNNNNSNNTISTAIRSSNINNPETVMEETITRINKEAEGIISREGMVVISNSRVDTVEARVVIE